MRVAHEPAGSGEAFQCITQYGEQDAVVFIAAGLTATVCLAAQVLEMARCEWIERRKNAIALGPSGTGKTHVASGLGLAAWQKRLAAGFTTAAAMVAR